MTAAGEVLLNEIAPRPHNSGHYTIDVTPCSQYEQHVRAICDLPLSPPRMFSNVIMMNVLGDGHRRSFRRHSANCCAIPTSCCISTAKRHAVARRKMGHFSMLVDGPVDDAAVARARAAHEQLSWVAA